MSSNAHAGKDAAVRLDVGAGMVTAHTTDISMPWSSDIHEVTSQGMDAKESIAGHVGGTQLSFNGVLNTDTYNAIAGHVGNSVDFEYLPVGSVTGMPKISGSGILQKFDITSAGSDAVKYSADIQISGNITRGTVS